MLLPKVRDLKNIINRKIKITIVLGLFLISFVSIDALAVRMDNEDTIVADQIFEFHFIGLNESQWYIVTFDNHSNVVANETFLSGGFEYKFDRLIPPDTDGVFFVSIYQYNTTTEINSSSLLYTRQFRLVTTGDLNNLDFIIQNLEFIVPIIIIALFTYVFISEANKRRTPRTRR